VEEVPKIPEVKEEIEEKLEEPEEEVEKKESQEKPPEPEIREEKPKESFPMIRPRVKKKSELISFKLSGELAYMMVGDFNKKIEESRNNYYNDLDLYYDYSSLDGEYKKFNFGPGFEVEVRVNPIPQLGIGIGIEYIHGWKKSNPTLYYSQTYSWGTYDSTNEIDFSYSVTVIPVKLGLYFNLPLSPELNVVLNGGLGYYFAKLSWEENWEWDDDGLDWWGNEYNWIGEDRYSTKASSKGIGFHGGFGFELGISENFAFVVEGQSRYAKIKNLEGDDEWSYSEEEYMNGTLYDTWSDSEKTHGSLYSYEWKSSLTGKYYFTTALWEEEPTNHNRRNIREATLDLTGFSIKVGIRIKLF